jgi:hypothetical protein
MNSADEIEIPLRLLEDQCLMAPFCFSQGLPILGTAVCSESELYPLCPSASAGQAKDLGKTGRSALVRGAPPRYSGMKKKVRTNQNAHAANIAPDGLCASGCTFQSSGGVFDHGCLFHDHVVVINGAVCYGFAASPQRRFSRHAHECFTFIARSHAIALTDSQGFLRFRRISMQ